MRPLALIVLAFVTLAGCQSATLNGSGSEHGGLSRIKMGVPF
jgi:hypothetical protein